MRSSAHIKVSVRSQHHSPPACMYKRTHVCLCKGRINTAVECIQAWNSWPVTWAKHTGCDWFCQRDGSKVPMRLPVDFVVCRDLIWDCHLRVVLAVYVIGSVALCVALARLWLCWLFLVWVLLRQLLLMCQLLWFKLYYETLLIFSIETVCILLKFPIVGLVVR